MSEQHELPLKYTEDLRKKTMSKDKTMPKQKTTAENQHMNKWVAYRPETKILDCTIRDGGLMNSHSFTDDVVGAVYTACVDAVNDVLDSTSTDDEADGAAGLRSVDGHLGAAKSKPFEMEVMGSVKCHDPRFAVDAVAFEDRFAFCGAADDDRPGGRTGR